MTRSVRVEVHEFEETEKKTEKKITKTTTNKQKPHIKSSKQLTITAQTEPKKIIIHSHMQRPNAKCESKFTA